MRNILLVGGAGYIGAVVAQHFIEKGYTVKVVDNLIYENNIGVAHLFSHQNTASLTETFRKKNISKIH